MKVSISKSKNTTIYYLSRSVRVGNKTTTKTVEKIGVNGKYFSIFFGN